MDRPRPVDTKADRPAPRPAPKAAAPAAVPSKPVPKPKVTAPLPLHVPLPRAATASKPALTAKEALKLKTAQGGPKSVKPTEKAAEAPAFNDAQVNVGADGAKDAILGAGGAATALVDAWQKASNAVALAAVADAEDLAGPARKAAKRALNVLRARGIAVPEKKATIVRMDDRASVAIEATLMPPDNYGTESITIASRDGSGRWHIAEVIVRESVGVLQAGAGWISGSALKESRGRSAQKSGMAPAPVPVEWARWKIANARRLNAQSGYVVPLGLQRCIELIEPPPSAEPAHPMADLEATLSAELATAATATSALLHYEPEFAGWLPHREAIEEMLGKVGEALGEEGVKDSARAGEALKAETEAAIDRFFSPELREMIAERMRDAAISVRARRGDAKAADVLAVARAIREAGLITSPPREVPFLVGFFDKALSVVARENNGRLTVPVPRG